jgi:hypothetical protein
MTIGEVRSYTNKVPLKHWPMMSRSITPENR